MPLISPRFRTIPSRLSWLLRRHREWVLAILILVSVFNALQAQTCSAPSSGLTNWWPFDGPTSVLNQTADIAGGQAAVFTTGGTPNFTTGYVGKSTCGAGALATWAIRGPNSLNLLRGDFTFEFWTQFTAGAIHGTNFLEATGWQLFGVNRWIVGFEASSISGTGQSADGNLVVAAMRPESIGGELRIVKAPFVAEAGKWYHIAITRNGKVYTIYLNGVALAAATNSIDPGPPDPNLATLTFIGNGCLDEPTLYNRALTGSEIGDVVLADHAGKCKQLSISTNSIPDFYLAGSANFQLSAILYSGPVTWSLASGTLPPGLLLDSSGKLSGQPKHAGSFSFTVQVRDASMAVAQKTFTSQVLLAAPPPDIRIYKTGTAVIPGRVSQYFILVENRGTVTAENLAVFELVEPWFTYKSAIPAPSSIETLPRAWVTPVNPVAEPYPGILNWVLPVLSPGDSRVITYTVQLDQLVPIGTPVTGKACRENDCMRNCRALFKQCVNLRIEACELLRHTATQAEYERCTSAIWPTCDFFFDSCKKECRGPECYPDTKPAVGPVDPNEKLVTAKSFILPGQTLAYPIHFENVGTAEARDVFVTDTLDPSLDLSTVKITPSDQASVDLGSRTIKWSLIGRNLLPGESDAVLLSVKPKDGLPSGTVIRNSATIKFEVFAPMSTNQTVTTIDSTKPSCRMAALPARSSPGNLTLSWTGSDAVGQVSTFSVWVSVNGGAFTQVLVDTTQTSAVFPVETGKTYGFVCVATDVAGNVETKSDLAEVTTTVGALPGDVNGDGVVDCKDISIVRAAFGSRVGEAKFDLRADVVADGVIDVRDLAFVSQKLPAGTRCQ